MSWVYQGTDTITSSGTYTVPAGVSALDVFVHGEGGKGGDYDAVQEVGGAGGGGGGMEYALKLAVQQGDQFTVTISNGQARFTRDSPYGYIQGNPGVNADFNRAGQGGTAANMNLGGYGINGSDGEGASGRAGARGGASNGTGGGAGGAGGNGSLCGGNGGNYGGGGGGGGDAPGNGAPAAAIILKYALQNQ